jgi:RND family efflux transporter MFP subunit
VVVQPVTREVITENRSYIGFIDFDRTSRVSSDVAGLVKSVLVNEGDRVKKGDPLVRLDTELLDQEIALRKTRIDQAQLRIELAGKNLKRLETLLSRKGTSEKNYDDALFSFQDSQAEKKSSELELQKLLIQKRKSEIRAPFDGIILEKNVETGDWVQQGTLLAAVGSTQDIIVRVPVEESVLQFITPGEQVPVTLSAFNRELTGTITQVDPVADERTRNVFLKIHIPPQDGVIDNLSATVFIPTSAKRELSILPRDALIKFKGRDFVYTVKDGKASLLPVNIVTFLGSSVGADNPYFVPGMVVVVEGNERLRPDQAVTIKGTD